MFKLIILVVGCIYVATALEQGEGLSCFHCYESYNDTLSPRSSENNVYGGKLVPCDKNRAKWNTWVCPASYPVCFIMSGRVKNQVEILRSCGQRGICDTYRPPSGVTLEICRECNTTLCNEFLKLPNPPTPNPPTPNPPAPNPPVTPGFFNVKANIDINVKKLPKI